MPTVLRKQYTFYKQMTAMKSHEVTTAFTPAFTEKRQPLLVLYCVIPLFSEATKHVFSQYNPTIPSHGGDNPPSRLCGAGAGETGETASAAASG